MGMFVEVLLCRSISWWWPRFAIKVGSQWQLRLAMRVGSMLVLLLGWWIDDDKCDNNKIRFVCFLKMMWVGHVLDHMPDHVLDHMIIGFVTMALHLSTFLKKTRERVGSSICFILTIINLKMVIRELLCPADLTKAQIFYIHELLKVIIISTNETLMFVAF